MKSNSWISMGLAMVLMASVIGCAQFSRPITDREQTTGLGALAGGVAGAIIGSVTGSAVTGGLIGMPLGAAAGFYIGDRLEAEDTRGARSMQQETELAQLRQENVRLKQEQARREEQRAREAALAAAPKPEPPPPPPPPKARPAEAVPANVAIGFDTDKSDPSSDAGQALNAIIIWLKGDPGRQVAVDGYTDNVGSEDYNLTLSQRRAESIRKTLVQSGVSPDQIEARGMGEANPVSSNDTSTGREHNRRVEVTPRREK